MDSVRVLPEISQKEHTGVIELSQAEYIMISIDKNRWLLEFFTAQKHEGLSPLEMNADCTHIFSILRREKRNMRTAAALKTGGKSDLTIFRENIVVVDTNTPTILSCSQK